MDRELTVLHFASAISGGAGIAAQKIHRSLRARGIASHFYYRQGIPPDESFEQLPWWQGSKWRYRTQPKLIALEAWQGLAGLGRSRGLPPFSYPWLGFANPTPPIDDKTIVHLHWLGKSLDLPRFLAQIPSTTPLVWTLHDMNPVTGGCHYTNGCELFRNRCHPCPQLPFRLVPSLAARSQEAKRRSLRGKNLHIVGNSHWIEARARESSVLQSARTFRTIHCGVETDTFVPQSKSEARKRLHLPEKALLIGFGAEAIHFRWKGFAELRAALEHLRSDQAELLTFGYWDPKLSQLSLPHHHVGTLADRHDLARVYSAMDIFVIPSLQEAFGQTALEAIACGTPVVGFQSGGIPDTVRNGTTGLTVPTGDVAALASAIRHLMEHPELRRQMGENGRKMAIREFGIQLQGERYEGLYREAFTQHV